MLSSLQRPDNTERMIDASGIQREKLERVRVVFTKTLSVSRAFCLVVLNGHSSWEIKKISKVPQESEAHWHSKYFNHYSEPLPLQGT